MPAMAKHTGSGPAFPAATDATTVSYQQAKEHTPLVIEAVPLADDRTPIIGSALEMELERGKNMEIKDLTRRVLRTVTQTCPTSLLHPSTVLSNRPRRIFLASLAALALLILGSLFLVLASSRGGHEQVPPVT